MQHVRAVMAVALAAAVQSTPYPTQLAMAAEAKAGPATIQAIDGTKLRRVTLTQKAADRLDIQTGQIAEGQSGRRTAPYAAILYDLAGGAWVYTSPAPLTYVRHGVVIEEITGVDAYLKDGPPAGTSVVTVGVAQLYGAEKGVGH